MQCLQLSVSQFVMSHGEEEVGEIPAVVGEAQDTLQSLVERMIKSEPEDFELVRQSTTKVCLILSLLPNFQVVHYMTKKLRRNEAA